MDWNVIGAVVISGLLIVFLILGILIGIVLLVGKLLYKKPVAAPQPQKPAEPAPAVAAAPAPVVQSGIEEEVVAVITAAIAAAAEDAPAGTAYAVKSISRAREVRPAWGYAGMRQNTEPF